MHPTLSLAKRKLDDLQIEFDQATATEADVVPGISAQNSLLAFRAVATLKASLIEGVYTGTEGLLKEILSVVDGGIPSSGESWHARLLAQAAQSSTERDPIISEEVFAMLDKLRAFRHIERLLYRHSLREDSVDENFELMKEALPAFVADVETFIAQYRSEDVNDVSITRRP